MPSILVQVEQLRLRLAAFAPWQAGWVAQGWRIEHVETGPEEGEAAIVVDGQPMFLRGRIDRIDVHESSGKRMIFDYKSADPRAAMIRASLPGVGQLGVASTFPEAASKNIAWSRIGRFESDGSRTASLGLFSGNVTKLTAKVELSVKCRRISGWPLYSRRRPKTIGTMGSLITSCIRTRHFGEIAPPVLMAGLSWATAATQTKRMQVRTKRLIGKKGISKTCVVAIDDKSRLHQQSFGGSLAPARPRIQSSTVEDPTTLIHTRTNLATNHTQDWCPINSWHK